MQVFNPSATFTRPADTTAYSTGDIVANSTTAGSVVPMTFTLGNSFGVGQLRFNRARLYKSGTGVTNASFRIHIFQAIPATISSGDNAAMSVSGSADWLGNIDVTSMIAFTDGAAGTGSLPAGSEAFTRLASGIKIFGILQAQAAYTPSSAETFTVVFEEVDDF